MSTRLNATKVLLAGASALALAGGTVGAAAALSTDLTVRNTLELDTVNIRIQQQSTNLPLLISNGSYPHSATITNLGADCYVRVRVVANAADLQTTLTSMDGLDEKDWLRAGNLLYYRHVLPENATLQFTQQVTNPWAGKNLDSKQLTLTITAEAVQARNFTPDFSSADPWGSTAVEKCVNSRKSVSDGNLANDAEKRGAGENDATDARKSTAASAGARANERTSTEAGENLAGADDGTKSNGPSTPNEEPVLTETILTKPLHGASEGGTQ